MYEKIVQPKQHKKMKEFFLNLSIKGKKKECPKKSEIEIIQGGEFGIVTKGKIGESIISSEGAQKELYFLVPGEIFGETAILEKTTFENYIYAIEDSEISLVSEKTVREVLLEDPASYGYFYHSLFRKYQVAKYQLLNLVFTDSFRNVCDTLLRIAAFDNPEDGKLTVRTTHQHLADLIGCSRITVTKTLNYLKEQGVIRTEKKSIEITDAEKLKSCIPGKVSQADTQKTF